MTTTSASLVQLRESLNEAIEALGFFDTQHPIASVCQGRLQRMADFLDTYGKRMRQALVPSSGDYSIAFVLNAITIADADGDFQSRDNHFLA